RGAVVDLSHVAALARPDDFGALDDTDRGHPGRAGDPAALDHAFGLHLSALLATGPAAAPRARVSGDAFHRDLARHHHPRRWISRPVKRVCVAGCHLLRAAHHECHVVPKEPPVMRRSWLPAAAVVALAGCSGLAHVEPSKYPDPKRDSITFWGHACSYIDVG